MKFNLGNCIDRQDNRMRLTVIHRIGSALAVVLLLGLTPVLMIFNGLKQLEQTVGQVTDIDEPISVAAYEMEISTIGGGMAVLKYLDTR